MKLRVFRCMTKDGGSCRCATPRRSSPRCFALRSKASGVRAGVGPRLRVTRHPGHVGGSVGAFSLVELVISLAILSVGLVGAMRVFPVGLRASQRAEMSSRAALAAQRAIESLKLKAWETLEEGETITEEDAFTVTTRITQPHTAHLADPTRLKALAVTVEWLQDRRPRTLTFLTYVRRETS